ncbi:hypothetical protein EPA93_26280 [Ktedonosporobacter rubrisoli]|uniref:Uncharacterized protein n=1 Tax=Ktedonosporobacter rubrisoli TaxID=2509675 RepID=A0A4P6JUY1_KTERU|nr:hypothetical protein [Ktedonosporobacter rubrisoli]QBD79304.1 hypothetical protein EPA93_26280 [Ktedonosporobacter rubrisoli]
MKRQPHVDPLRPFLASELELISLGEAILFYMNYLRHLHTTHQPISEECNAAGFYLQQFYDRLVAQLSSAQKCSQD